MSIEVLRPGLLTTLQDLGRYGYQRYGVVVDGAMDELSHRIANLIVGNDDGEATLELTLQGPSLVFRRPALIAVCGADMSASVDGRTLPMHRPVLVRSGCRIDFGSCQTGCRAYLAVRGGFQVAPVMGSRSTYVRGGLGGHQGRALRRGDVVETGTAEPEAFPSLHGQLSEGGATFATTRWRVSPLASEFARKPGVVRVMPGRNWSEFPRAMQKLLVLGEYRVGLDSDRMGYRLEGPELKPRRPLEMISEAIAFGTIQVPPDGRPIVLMADRQTTGGYPKIADVASVDLPVLAQTQPRGRIRFEVIEPELAQQLYLAREQELYQVRQGVDAKRGE